MKCKFQIGDRARFVAGVFEGWDVIIDKIDEPGQRLWFLIKPLEKGRVLSLELDFGTAQKLLAPVSRDPEVEL